MRCVKVLGLVVVAAVVSMAVAASAVAGPTALCDANELPCDDENQLHSLHMALTPGTVLELLALGGINITVLCLNTLLQASVLDLGSPQGVHTTEFTLTSCGTNAAHNNCTYNSVEPPLWRVLKTAANLGTLEIEHGKRLVRCVVGGFIVVHCVFGLTGLAFEIEGALHQGNPTGHGMLTSEGTLLPPAESGGLCPDMTLMHGLLEPLPDHVWISS